MRLKVLFISSTKLSNPSHAASYYYPFYLAKSGHEVSVLGLCGGNPDDYTKNGIQTIETTKIKKYLSAYSLIKTFQPDIVHVFMQAGSGIFPLIRYLSKSNTKYLLDIRSPLLVRGGRRVLHRFKNYFEPLLYDAIAGHGIESARTVIGDSYDIHYLPPGVDFTLIPSVKHSHKSTVFKTVYIGALTKQRKLKNMINAFAVIIQNYPDAILDIYGDGDDRKNLEEYVNKYKLSDHIKFKGLVSRPELLSSLYNYDIGFSYIPEGLHDPAPALKTLEYLACGLPVVATDTSGNRLSVKDGYNGVLSTDSPQDYASAFIRLVQSEWYMDAVSNSVKSVLEYDWEAIVRKNLLPIYEKMMSNE